MHAPRDLLTPPIPRPIDPLTIADFVRNYGQMNKADCIACWHNALKRYDIADKYKGVNEPGSLTAARTLLVHAHWADYEPCRAAAEFSAALLVAPFLRDAYLP